jgi:hypothetical protein
MMNSDSNTASLRLNAENISAYLWLLFVVCFLGNVLGLFTLLTSFVSTWEEDIAFARYHGANDRNIHDTVLIAAAFSMYNRYVDGLASLTPTDNLEYEAMGKRMVAIGYVMPEIS